MHEFTDNEDRTWRVEINIGAVKEIRGTLEVDLLDMGGGMLAAMIDDPVALCDMLYVLCRSQAEVAGVSDEDFGRGLRGDTIDAASAAFLEELTDFFPSRRRRMMQAAMEKLEALQDKATERTMAMLEGDHLDRILDEQVDKSLSGVASSGDGSTSSPASPVSTPDH